MLFQWNIKLNNFIFIGWNNIPKLYDNIAHYYCKQFSSLIEINSTKVKTSKLYL